MNYWYLSMSIPCAMMLSTRRSRSDAGAPWKSRPSRSRSVLFSAPTAARSMTYGSRSGRSVRPVFRATEAEAILVGQSICNSAIREAAQAILRRATPVSGPRASASYRLAVLPRVFDRALRENRRREPGQDFTHRLRRWGSRMSFVTVVVNGREERMEHTPFETLLDALRDRLHLTGAKDACREGESTVPPYRRL